MGTVRGWFTRKPEAVNVAFKDNDGRCCRNALVSYYCYKQYHTCFTNFITYSITIVSNVL